MRAAPVIYLEPVVGIAWWTVGAAAFDAGNGTVILAAGIAVAVGLIWRLRRSGIPAPLRRRARGSFLRTCGFAVALVAVAVTALGYTQWGEIAIPVAAVIIGVAAMTLSSRLDERAFLALGAGLFVVGAAGAFLAFGTAGLLYPQGLVGLGSGVLFWLTGAQRTGMFAALRHRSYR